MRCRKIKIDGRTIIVRKSRCNIDSSNAFLKSISQNTVSSENNSILNKEITVSGNSFSEIQNAINSANEGDTIILKGTYNLVESQIQVNKKLSFI